MKHINVIIILIIFSVSTCPGFSQNLHTSSNKALKVYNEGLQAFDFLNYSKAEENFKDAVRIDERFLEAYMMLGELYSKMEKYSQASVNYKLAIGIDSLFFKPVFFNLANAELYSGNYQDALIHYKVYIAQKGMSEKNVTIANHNIKNCEFALEAIRNPIPFDPVALNSKINTRDDEYWPSITADGNTMMFTRQAKVDNSQSMSNRANEDFYISNYTDDEWQTSRNAGAPLNTIQNEGAQSLSSDGNYMFFTACGRSNGLGSCDLYFSFYNNGRWTEPYNLGSPVNTSSWESQPSISADGEILFFSSSRPGGVGGKDIWYSVLNNENSWTQPVNMGELINTAGDEMSPFIHFDGRTLYFSSDGRVGMGGFDIYMTRLNEDSTWSTPQNLGYPINSYNDEMGLIIDATGQKAFFSSIRDDLNGKDIFYFNLHESVRPSPVSYLKGKVYDRETGQLIKANYELVNLSTGRVKIKGTTDATGNFLVCLPAGFNYGINVNKPGYLFYSENFMFEGQHTVVEPFIKKITLNSVKVGEKILLSNVFYEVNSWQLKRESLSELNNLVSLLNYNKDIVVEIGGYTDSTGTDEYNLTLSGKRALSVVNYLNSKGIDLARLKYKGYGNVSPVGDNITFEGRQQNRRTEVKVIDLKK